jgi:hypothetical protein
MRINPRKVRKILGSIWTAPNRTFETFCTQEAPRCIGMNATRIEPIYLFQKIKQRFFSYTRFPVNKINVEKFLKL